MTTSRFRHPRPGASRSPVNRSGAAIIEFALTAPILVSLLLGVSDLAPTLMAKFKVGNATQAVADLTTQTASFETADMSNYFAIGGDVMAPFPATNLWFRITNIASDGKGNAFVYWSCGQGPLPPRPSRDPVTTTPTGTGLSTLVALTSLGTNTSFVMVESQYGYTAPAGYVLPSVQLMTSIAYALPRVSTYIGSGNGNPAYVPTPPATATHATSTTSGTVTCNTSY